MNKLTTIISFIALAGFLALAVLQFTGKEKIAYIDNIKLLSNYDGMKAINAKLDEKTKVWQSRVDTLEADFTNLLKKYEKDMKSMSEKEKKSTEALLKKKQSDIVQYKEISQQKIKEEEQRLTKEAVLPVDEFIKEYGKKHKYKIILGAGNMGNIVYADEAINITDILLEELNKKYNN